jgi:hypothetical protein
MKIFLLQGGLEVWPEDSTLDEILDYYGNAVVVENKTGDVIYKGF